jgi:dTMP kinase
MKTVLAVEGIDGSGKTTLVAFARKLCEEHGLPFTSIGRGVSSANPLIGRLTRFLQEEITGLTPRADTFLRIARDYQRACLAALVPEGLVILDRFVLSILALARIRQLDTGPIVAILHDIMARGHLSGTILVQCPLEEARRRVADRGVDPESSNPGRFHFQREVQDVLQEEFDRGLLTGKQWLVDNSQSSQKSQEQVTRVLMPYLQKRRSPTSVSALCVPNDDPLPDQPACLLDFSDGHPL